LIITNVAISNYRGITGSQLIPLNRFSSIVGKNDTGKSIILNSIATFLNPRDNPVTLTDFNNAERPIEIACRFLSEELREVLEARIKSRIKKADGLDEFLDDILIDRQLTIRKTVATPKKGFDAEQVLMVDYEEKDFQFLYGKSDEELNEILDRYQITIPVQGRGRNSKLEKIKHIKEYCKSNNIGRSARYIDDEFKICSLLPDVELFKADYGLEVDTRFKSNSVSEILEYLERESVEKNKLAVIESEISDEMQKEANSVKKYMSEYVSNLKEVEIRPTISWKDAIKSVDVSFQFDGDARPIPMSHKGAGYRRLFMVARFRYLAEKNKGINVIYLIEEPETFLHPSAQNDLLNALRELSDDNQVIITTHSPVFAGATYIESVILCKRASGSIYENCNQNGKDAFLKNIVDELGIKPSYNLRDSHEKIVFVESHNDAKFYDIICQKLIDKPLVGVDTILVLPFGGGEDIDSFLNIDYFDNSCRDLYLIIDSDKHKNNFDKQKERADRFQNNKQRGSAYVLERSCLENYYHHKAFERTYDLVSGSFPVIVADDDVRAVIKQYKKNHAVSKNIKEKNNFDVFDEMTKEEWKEVVESELIKFLMEVVA